MPKFRRRRIIPNITLNKLLTNIFRGQVEPSIQKSILDESTQTYRENVIKYKRKIILGESNQ